MLFGRGGEFADASAHDFVGDGHVNVTNCSCDTRVSTPCEFRAASGHDQGESAVLVRIRFSVFMYKHQAGMVEQGAVAFRHRLEFRNQVSKLLNMPPADVAQNVGTVRSVRT